MRRLVGATLALAMVGCGSETVDVELNFPSQEAFVRMETARIFVLGLEDGGEDSCPDLLSQAELGVLQSAADIDSGQNNVCEFDAARITLPDVPEGTKAFVAIALDEGGDILLSGCTIYNVYAEPAPLRIVLAPTADYRSQFPAGTPPPDCTKDEKCQLGCS